MKIHVELFKKRLRIGYSRNQIGSRNSFIREKTNVTGTISDACVENGMFETRNEGIRSFHSPTQSILFSLYYVPLKPNQLIEF